MYVLRYYKARGLLELYIMQEYGFLYSHNKELERRIKDIETIEKNEVAFTRDLKKCKDILEVGMNNWFSMYKELIGKKNLTRTNFERELCRKNFIPKENR